MEEKLGQEPIFPTSVNNHYVGEGVEGNPVYYKPLGDTGMNKRFYAACAAMQGILASSKGFMYKSGNTSYSLFNKVEFAYECADELLRQENL